MNARLLTTREAAERLGVTPETVLRWIGHARAALGRRLPSRAIRYHEDELEAWLESGATGEDAPRSDSYPGGRAHGGGYARVPFPRQLPRREDAATTEED